MFLKTRTVFELLGFIAFIVCNCSEGKNSDCKNTFLEIMLELCHGPRFTREEHISRKKYVLENRYRYKRQSPDTQERLITLPYSKLPIETVFDSIFNLSEEETEEIIGEYYYRVPRSSFTKQELMDKVAKCCSNIEYCKKNPQLVCNKT